MEAMRHIVRREGQRRQSRFMPCPRQFGRWLWGLTEVKCISLARLRTLQARHFIRKIPFLRLPQKHLSVQANFAPPANRSSPRQGAQGFDRTVKFPSLSVRRWPGGGAWLHERTTSVFDPKGLLPFPPANGLAGFFDWQGTCSK